MFSIVIQKRSAQTGATLIVSLVILAVVTLLGVASMRNSNMELRMAASARDRAVAFQTAEAALVRIENEVVSKFKITNVLPDCNLGAECFNPTCNNGLCFTGDMDGIAHLDECRLVNTSGEVKQPWKDPSNWSNTARHRVISVNSTKASSGGFESADVRYMVEFLCFVPASATSIDDGINSRDSGVPLYRITVRAEGEARRSAVVLQSVYRAAR